MLVSFLKCPNNLVQPAREGIHGQQRRSAHYRREKLQFRRVVVTANSKLSPNSTDEQDYVRYADIHMHRSVGGQGICPLTFCSTGDVL